MLRKLSAVLVAAALIAGPAIAAQPSGGSNSTPTATGTPGVAPAVTLPAPATPAQASKPVRHVSRHMVRHKTGKIKAARHFKSHKKRVAAHSRPVKTGKISKVGKASKIKQTGKTSKVSKTGKNGKPSKPAQSNQG